MLSLTTLLTYSRPLMGHLLIRLYTKDISKHSWWGNIVSGSRNCSRTAQSELFKIAYQYQAVRSSHVSYHLRACWCSSSQYWLEKGSLIKASPKFVMAPDSKWSHWSKLVKSKPSSLLDVQKEIRFSFLDFRSPPVTLQTSLVSTACGCCHGHSPSTRHKRSSSAGARLAPGESKCCLTCSCTLHDLEFHPEKIFTLYNPKNKAVNIDNIENNKIVL